MARLVGRLSLLLLLVLSILLTVLVIPGVGLETRGIGSFPTWQQSLFSVGGPIVLLLNLAAVGLVAWRLRAGAGLSIPVGLADLLLSTVGLVGFGAPPPPAALVPIEILHLLVALGLVIISAAILIRPRDRPEPIVSS